MKEQILPVLPRNCRLLEGLQENELKKALDFFSAIEAAYCRGAFVHQAGKPLVRFGILLEGSLQVFMEDVEGLRMVMASVTPGESFGEALSYLRVPEAPIFIEAVKDSRILWLSPKNIRAPLDNEKISMLMRERFIAMMAKKMLLSNDRIQVLSKRTLRKKLHAFFSQRLRDSNGKTSFSVPFDRAGMADYLGSDRAALSRELSAMKKEGLIDYSGNRFILTPLYCAKSSPLYD